MSVPANRLLVLAGGTGGHVYPALAVANALRADGTDVIWLGTRRGLEATVVPANQIPIEWISVEGLRGRGAVSWLLAPFKLLRAMWQSMRAIHRIQPDCILGMGGFVAGPGGLAARLLGKPLIVHEQNAVAGLTNRYLAKFADQILTGFPNVDGLPESARWVGNPVRESITPGTEAESTDSVRVLVVGGSQGAASFNQHLPAVFARQPHALQIRHQCGREQRDAVLQRYREQGVEAEVMEFIEDMGVAYHWADLLICRAGAMTIAECCAAAKPSLLIPYPHSAGDHQVKNAEALVHVGAALMLSNAELASPKMIDTLSSLLADRARLDVMGLRAHELHKPDALLGVANVCKGYLYA